MVKNKLFICKEWNIQPSEIDRLPYYDYEFICEQINIIQKEQEKQQKEQEKEYASMQKNMNPSSMMSSLKNNLPNMANMKMPSMNFPK